MTGIHVAEDVCFPVAHRQVVFTIPKRLRIHARFDRKILGKLMEIISFIDPPQNKVIEKILKHCRLWKASPPRGPPEPFDMDQNLDSEFMNQTQELTFVDMDTFLSTF